MSTIRATEMESSPAVARQVLRGRRLITFLLLTFGLSWGFELLIALTIGHRTLLGFGLAPWSMYVPAAVGLALQRFVTDRSAVDRQSWDKSRVIPLSFLALTALHALVVGVAILRPELGPLLGGLGNLLSTLWTLLLFALYTQVGSDGFRRVDLPLGDLGRGFGVALATTAFMLSQFALNLAFGLGGYPGRQETVYGVVIPAGGYPLALTAGLGLAVTGVPLAGLATTFGEEVAWRGILLGAWSGRGRRRAALLTGIVWGIWHIPVILTGVHTYPPTPWGILVALAFFTLWGVVQSHTVLTTGSIWVAAFLHGLVNSVYALGIAYLAEPKDSIRSFGLGLYGLLTLAPIVMLLLRDPVWTEETH